MKCKLYKKDIKACGNCSINIIINKSMKRGTERFEFCNERSQSSVIKASLKDF